MPAHDPDDMTTGCLLALFGALVLIGTWVSLGLSGQADFHALSVAGVTIYGFDSLTATVMRSDDGGGRRWQPEPGFP